MEKDTLLKAQNGDLESIILIAKAYYDKKEGEENRGIAAEWYQKALLIAPNDSRAINGLANCYINGFGVDTDRKRAMELYRRAANQGYVNAIYNLAFELKTDESPECIEWFTKATDLGDVDAPYDLAWIYKEGKIVPTDLSKYIEYLCIASELGNHYAETDLAFEYLAGEFVEHSATKAKDLLERAANGGNVTAAYNLALFYKKGEDIDQDIETAVAWAKKAADLGDDDALFTLGVELFQGDNNIDQDQAKALECFLYAANLGNTTAMKNVAVCYSNGYGTEQDVDKAIAWAKKQADQGNDAFLFSLAVDLFHGTDTITKDQAKALDCFLYAAELGNVTAMENVAVCYNNGYGVEKNKDTAITYYKKAANRGSSDSISMLSKLFSEVYGVDGSLKLVDYLKSEADNGNAWSIVYLAEMYMQGEFVSKDETKGIELHKQAAALKNGYSLFILGKTYLNGTSSIHKDEYLATDYLFKGKQVGDIACMCLLASCYQDGVGVEKNLSIAFDLYNEAASTELPESQYQYRLYHAYKTEAQYQLYDAYENGQGVEEDHEVAEGWLNQAAENGHEIALAVKGFHARIDGDAALAAEYWEKAIKKGNLKVTFDLAELYLTGEENLSENKERAIELHRINAERGYAPSQVSLGVCYTIGDGVAVDLVQGTEWFRKAAEQGEMFGQQNYAIALREGKGVQQNPSLAIKYFTMAASQGSAQSKLCLARMYQNGEGTAKDSKKALALYRELLNDPNNKYHNEVKSSMADIYVHEYRDFDSAFKMYQELANDGDIKGIGCLAIFYYNGWGTPKDIGQALQLMEIAAQSDPAAQSTLNEWKTELISSASPNNMQNEPPRSTQNNPSTQGTKGPCYIATCVYGSYDCPEVWTLRRFRDHKLSTTVFGRLFIKTYYSISPILVKVFGNTSVFQKSWRLFLDGVIKILNDNGYSNKPYKDE